MKLRHLLLLASLAFAVAPALDAADKKKGKEEAAEKTPDATLSQWKLGNLITGPEVKLEDIKNKGVVIEYWGVNCGPCLASLPDMEKLAKRNKETVAFIGAHSQNATDDEVKAVVKKNKLSYTITAGANGPVSVSGIPHAVVFDAAGKLIYSGHPASGDFEKAVRAASKSAKTSATAGA